MGPTMSLWTQQRNRIVAGIFFLFKFLINCLGALCVLVYNFTELLTIRLYFELSLKFWWPCLRRRRRGRKMITGGQVKWEKDKKRETAGIGRE